MKKSAVAVVKCEDYVYDNVYDSLNRSIELLGGINGFCRPGERIILKPNLLTGAKPEDAVTTHPAVFEAAANIFKDSGAVLGYGDSPAFGSGDKASRISELTIVSEKLGIEYLDFEDGMNVEFPEGKLVKHFFIAKAVKQWDSLVSISKMKTHGLTRITGALKNQFGCVSGRRKALYHAQFPDSDLFSMMLADLNTLLKPKLFIMDGILAMEGNGPKNGTPKKMNVILASSDPVALDTVFCKLINLDQFLVPTIVRGNLWGLGSCSDIEIICEDEFETLISKDFDVNRNPVSTTVSGKGIIRFIKSGMTQRPYIVESNCVSCGHCVSMCPVEPKALNFKKDRKFPVYDYSKCIRCYCCQETCPHDAIKLKTPLLGKLLG